MEEEEEEEDAGNEEDADACLCKASSVTNASAVLLMTAPEDSRGETVIMHVNGKLPDGELEEEEKAIVWRSERETVAQLAGEEDKWLKQVADAACATRANAKRASERIMAAHAVLACDAAPQTVQKCATKDARPQESIQSEILAASCGEYCDARNPECGSFYMRR